MKKKIIYSLIILMSIIGLILSSYLTYSHYSNKNVVCVINETRCNDVLDGEYSSLFFGIPNSLLGGLLFLM